MVAELVDAPDLGSGERLLVRVRVSPAALNLIYDRKANRYLIKIIKLNLLNL